MIIQAELKCKQTGCEADPCAVDSVTMAYPEGLTLSEVLRQKKEHDKTCRSRASVLYSDSCVCLRGGQLCSTPRKKYL